jgi:hypothetical protein
MDMFDLYEVGAVVVMVAGFLAVAVPAYWLVSGWWQDAREQRWFAPSRREGEPPGGSFEPALDAHELDDGRARPSPG